MTSCIRSLSTSGMVSGTRHGDSVVTNSVGVLHTTIGDAVETHMHVYINHKK